VESYDCGFNQLNCTPQELHGGTVNVGNWRVGSSTSGKGHEGTGRDERSQGRQTGHWTGAEYQQTTTRPRPYLITSLCGEKKKDAWTFGGKRYNRKCGIATANPGKHAEMDKRKLD